MKKFLLFVLFIFGLNILASDRLSELSQKADCYKGKFDHVILLEESDVQVKDNGMSIRTESTAVKVFSDNGCKQFHTVSFFYDPLTMNMKVIKAEIIRKNGKKEIINPDSIKKYPQPARAIYWPNNRISIPFGLLEPGDIVTYDLEKRGFSYALLSGESDDSRFVPPMKGHFYDIVNFQGYYPIILKKYSLELPKGKSIQYKIYKGDVNPYSEFTDYGMRYVFEKEDIKAIKREPNMVALSDICLKLLVSTTEKWEDKSEWFYSVNENFSFKVIPEVQKKVDEIIKDCTTDEEKIDVLNHWVAHYIRYSGLSMGEGEGFTLHPSDMIMRDRSGVCKDKASLLVTFLRAAGFDAVPAMTMAGSRIENFPADHFNHSVVALRQKDGSFRMLDPTWVPWVREQWSSAEQEQQYLIGFKEGQKLMTTPYSEAENHYYNLDAMCLIHEDGTLKASFQISLEGQTDARLRRYIKRNHTAESDAYFKTLLKDAFPDARITSLTYQNPLDISKNMTVDIHFEIPNYVIKNESTVFLKSPALFFLKNDSINRDLNLKVDAKERKYGIRSRCTKLYNIKEEIIFFNEINKEKSKIIENKKVDGEFADLNLTSEIDGKSLKTSLTISLKRRIYPKDAWNDLKEVIGSFQKAEKKYLKVTL